MTNPRDDNAKSYVIDLDFGTDSVRSVLVDSSNGQTFRSEVFWYPRWKEGETFGFIFLFKWLNNSYLFGGLEMIPNIFPTYLRKRFEANIFLSISCPTEHTRSQNHLF
ncbi:hypothetical protein QQ008_15605 [Fulvivirgaceae bacterium BMA10]|uniref:Carbohydrate kinase FGGY N-terminal domain-containing protein n=1 Tax=Splendidivirga corallicola TaxID=3051826 RepID=A0ABT8KTK9_9BACT|nr:hypothetical protein [Fulvivirgaceae bacterium BMA10]